MTDEEVLVHVDANEYTGTYDLYLCQDQGCWRGEKDHSRCCTYIGGSSTREGLILHAERLRVALARVSTYVAALPDEATIRHTAEVRSAEEQAYQEKWKREAIEAEQRKFAAFYGRPVGELLPDEAVRRDLGRPIQPWQHIKLTTKPPEEYTP